MEGYMGEIRLFAGNYAPARWAFCDGRTMQINEYQALYSILGTAYGGDGRKTFALPDLRSRVPVGAWRNEDKVELDKGLSKVKEGEKGGAETITLDKDHLPDHTHPIIKHDLAVSIRCSGSVTGLSSPVNNYLGDTNGTDIYAGSADGLMNKDAALVSGNISIGIDTNKHVNPVGLRNPYLGINYIICLQGIFPAK